jgi:hypothetical protein
VEIAMYCGFRSADMERDLRPWTLEGDVPATSMAETLTSRLQLKVTLTTVHTMQAANRANAGMGPIIVNIAAIFIQNKFEDLKNWIT